MEYFMLRMIPKSKFRKCNQNREIKIAGIFSPPKTLIIISVKFKSSETLKKHHLQKYTHAKCKDFVRKTNTRNSVPAKIVCITFIKVQNSMLFRHKVITKGN